MAQNIINTAPNQDDIKKYIPRLHKNMSGKTLEPYIDQAIKHHIIPCIGADFYNEVNDNIAGHTDLMTYLRPTVAWFTYHIALADSRAELGDMGLNQKSDTEGTILPASDKQFENQMWNALRTAYDELECLLWQHLCPNKASFPTFANSPQAEKCCKYFLTSPAIFREHAILRKHGGLEDWFAYIPTMNQVEQYCIKPILCTDLFNEIKAQLCDATLTPANQTLLTHIRFATGAIIREFHAAKNGVKLQARQNFVSEYTDSTRKRSRPDYRSMEHLFQYEQLTQHHAIRALLDTLSANADEYPLWRDSTCNPDYEDPDAEETSDECTTSTTAKAGYNTKSIYSI